MKSSPRCASEGSPVVAARCGASFSATRSASKKSLRAAEQERADVARARRRWMREQGMFDPARLVFLDETATSTNMVRLRGRCPRGQRLIAHVPHGHWKTITFVAGLRRRAVVAPLVLDGPMNATIFVAYLKECLAHRPSICYVPSVGQRVCLRRWGSALPTDRTLPLTATPFTLAIALGFV